MLTDLIELGCKMKEQMKDTQSEIKQNIQGTNSDRKETRTQSKDLEQKEKINIQPEQKEETRTVSYTHLTLPTIRYVCRSRWSPDH